MTAHNHLLKVTSLSLGSPAKHQINVLSETLKNFQTWLVVEGGVANERGHVDVTHAVEKESEVLRGEGVHTPGGNHVKHTLFDLK